MIEVQRPGLLTTVQDLGRPGWRHLGVPPGGAADPVLLELANRLVGNPPGAAGLEVTLRGPTLAFGQACCLAVGGDVEAACGGEPVPCFRTVALAAGSVLELRAVRRGCRAYLGIAGGLDVPEVLGSRATDLRGGFGGLAGRALRTWDRLGLLPSPLAPDEARGRLEASARPWAALPFAVLPPRPGAEGARRLRVLPGREGAPDLRGLTRDEWTVGPDSDRMGLRLDGRPLDTEGLREMVSAPVLPGTVQLPPGGRPVLLGVDAQTVGGYPVLAHVVRADLGAAMQLRPGDRLRFEAVDEAEAARAWAEDRTAAGVRARAIATRLGPASRGRGGRAAGTGPGLAPAGEVSRRG